MRKTNLFMLCAVAVWAQAIEQRPGTLMSGGVGMYRNGVGFDFHYATVVEPPPANMADVRLSGGTTGTGRTIHRDMTDEVHNQYFGYDLTAVAGPGAGQYTVTISPLTRQATTLTAVPLPKYPPPMVVNAGDTVALDLLVSPDGKQKVVDYFRISGPASAGPATTTAEPRDYTPDDGTVRLNSDGMVVLVNGQVFSDRMGTTTKPGATFWLTAPNQGRYILSLTPQSGFQKAGTIRDNVIAFRSDGQEYEIRMVSPVLGAKGAWNLYVMHDPRFQSRADMISVGLDRLTNLLPR